MSGPIVLPADVYDALAVSAERYGGIGAGEYYSTEHGRVVPCCAIGHLSQAVRLTGDTSLVLVLRAAGVSESANDRAVRRVLLETEAPLCARVPFADWCRELNVVRGDR